MCHLEYGWFSLKFTLHILLAGGQTSFLFEKWAHYEPRNWNNIVYGRRCIWIWNNRLICTNVLLFHYHCNICSRYMHSESCLDRHSNVYTLQFTKSIWSRCYSSNPSININAHDVKTYSFHLQIPAFMYAAATSKARNYTKNLCIGTSYIPISSLALSA